MLLFYLVYAVFLLLLCPRMVSGTGCTGFLLYFVVSIAVPFLGCIAWAYLFAPNNRSQAFRVAFASHILFASLILIYFLSLA